MMQLMMFKVTTIPLSCVMLKRFEFRTSCSLEQMDMNDEVYSVNVINESDFEDCDHVLQWNENEELEETWQ